MRQSSKPRGVAAYFPAVNEVHPSSLILFIRSVYPVSQAAEEYLNAVCRPMQVRKGELLCSAGEACPSLYLVLKGILRGFVNSQKREITTWITGEDQLVTCINSFLQQSPSLENMQALSDCDLIALDHDDLEYMYANFPEMNIVARKILQQYYADAEERAYISRLTEATDKYLHFVQTNGDMARRVPLKYIASYLGMTMETLSRIRGKLYKRKTRQSMAGV